MHETDVIIIGAGPVGLFSVFQCGMMRLKCHVIDALDHVGGQCEALYPEKPIYDIPAHPLITGHDLVENLKQQIEPFKAQYHLSQQVMGLELMDNKVWKVTTSTGTLIHAKVIIIAAGVGAFGPNRPPLPGINTYEKTSIFYTIRRKDYFKNKRVAIAGGGDSAVDWALVLSSIASKVYVVHRRSKFRAAPESIRLLHEKAQGGLIELVTPYQLTGLEGDGTTLSGLTVSTLSGDTRTLNIDYLLPFFGLSVDLGPISSWGLSLDKNHIIVDPCTNQTSIPGIFAVGDTATYNHKLKLILVGFAEAAQAAHQARSYIYPDQVWHFEHSTTQGLPNL